MKYAKLFIIASFLLSACGNEPTATAEETKTTSTASVGNIKEDAKIMGELLVKGDFAAFTKYTYPVVVEKMGGEAKMIEMLQTSTKQMEETGTKFLNLSFGEPSKAITVGDEIQCTLPQILEMKVTGGKLVGNSTLIAISKTNGKSWYFVDASGKSIATMREILPNLSSDLVIPPAVEPTFYKD